MDTASTLYVKILATLAEIAAVPSMCREQHEILQKILHIFDEQLQMRRGTIMLLSPDESELLIEAVWNKETVVDKNVKYRWGEGITGRVVSTGTPAVIARISEEPDFRDLIHKRKGSHEKDCAFICVPITIDSNVVGTLSVDIPEPHAIPLTDAEQVLRIASSMIAHDVLNRRQALQDRSALEEENIRLRDALGEDFRPENMVGISKEMGSVYQRIHQVSVADTTVLIRGESGTGKELVAAAIHFSSPRANARLIKVSCAALNENLLESELFGHEKGAFTGALYSRAGRIEEAAGGTLFLDEIGDISPLLQVKLLRVLQEKEFQKVGSNKTIKADVRIVAATNRNLEKAVSEELFRKDLYYRINVFPIHIPPLRERRDDTSPLVNHFIRKFSQKLHKPIRRINTPAINLIMQYHWPGNVRELENCIEHASLVCRDGVIRSHDLPPTLQMPIGTEISKAGTLSARINQVEYDMILDALKHTEGNVEATARILGTTARIVRYKIKNLQIDYSKYFTK